jgi:hypothetical protein
MRAGATFTHQRQLLRLAESGAHARGSARSHQGIAFGSGFPTDGTRIATGPSPPSAPHETPTPVRSPGEVLDDREAVARAGRDGQQSREV